MIFKKPSLFLKDKKWKSEKEKARGVGQEKKTTQVKSYFFFYIWKILKKNIIDSRVIIVLGGLLFMFFVPSILRNTLLKSRQKSLTQQFPFLSLSLSFSRFAFICTWNTMWGIFHNPIQHNWRENYICARKWIYFSKRITNVLLAYIILKKHQKD